MKHLFVLLVSLFAFLASVRADYQADVINAENYALREVMVSNRTYAGVCVNAQLVQVRTGKRGLLVGLPLGIVNFTCGTDIGVRKIPAIQYVIRLDQERGDNNQAKLVTVIQGFAGPMIAPGSPVFVETSGGEASYSARVIPATAPEKYGTQGMEEARQAAMDR